MEGRRLPLHPTIVLNVTNPSEVIIDGVDATEDCCSSDRKSKDKHLEICSAKAAVTNEIKNVNKNYFGSYSSFAIHREMISDKVSI